jgi:hypothetical protein
MDGFKFLFSKLYSRKMILPAVLFFLGFVTCFAGMVLGVMGDPIKPADQWMREWSGYVMAAGIVIAIPGMYLLVYRLSGKHPNIRIN